MKEILFYPHYRSPFQPCCRRSSPGWYQCRRHFKKEANWFVNSNQDVSQFWLQRSQDRDLFCISRTDLAKMIADRLQCQDSTTFLLPLKCVTTEQRTGLSGYHDAHHADERELCFSPVRYTDASAALWSVIANIKSIVTDLNGKTIGVAQVPSPSLITELGKKKG